MSLTRCAADIAFISSRLLHRFWRYMLEPFCPSAWRKSFTELKGLSLARLRGAFFQVAIYYFVLSPLVAMPFYNTCIFHPSMAGDYSISELEGIKKQDVFFVSGDGTRLHGWYFARPGARKTVLLSHGNGGNLSNRQALCSLLLSEASVFIYDYRGYGLSKGTPSVDGCLEDAVAAFDYLRSTLKLPAGRIVLYGESLGTGFTCQLAARRPCASIILQSGFQSLPQIAREKIPLIWIYPNFLFPVNKLDNLSYVKDKHPPLLVIHGMQDSLIPPHNAEDLFAAASAKKSIIRLPKAGHRDVPANITYEGLVALSSFLR